MVDVPYQWLHWSRQQPRKFICLQANQTGSERLATELAQVLFGYFQSQNDSFAQLSSQAPAPVHAVFWQNSPLLADKSVTSLPDDVLTLLERKLLSKDRQTPTLAGGELNGDEFRIRVINAQQYRSQLGQENRLLVIDARQGFNPDAIAALSGTIIGGGVVVVIIDTQITADSISLTHFIGGIENRSNCLALNLTSANEKSEWLAPLTRMLTFHDVASDLRSLPDLSDGAVNQAQQEVVAGIVKVASGKRDRPMVLTADRGRGKTTALALASRYYLQQHSTSAQLIKIVITAPTPQAVATYFRHLQDSEGWQVNGLAAQFAGHQVKFMPLEQLIEEKQDCHLLLVDEAAGIPIPQLLSLSKQYHRLVFASTVHGYEGAGRGFTHKFLPYLRATYPGTRLAQLREPVRWSVNDELEQLLFERFFLNASLAELPSVASLPITAQQLRYRWGHGRDLLDDEQLFSQVIALLVSAHYQTKPSDLKLILDDPNLVLGLQFSELSTAEQQAERSDTTGNNHLLVGVVLLLFEGGLAPELVEKISRGERRIPGHFTPQSLLTQANADWAFAYTYGRIVRIAVHPDLQNQGLGQQLLSASEQYAIERDINGLSTSFGVNSTLFNFWYQAGFQIARLGFSRDKASGEHSVLMLKALTPGLRSQAKRLQQQWRENLPGYLSDEFKTLPASLMAMMLSASSDQQNLGVAGERDIDADNLQQLQRFIDGSRQYSYCVPALHKLLMSLAKNDYSYVKNIASQDEPERHPHSLLLAKVLQKVSVTELVKRGGVSGQKALLQQLKDATRALLSQQTY
ncbi:GNAT family N-acetyltransferase [Thalassotalea mangrovi]|nr:GNAT family N-acetyltransferase [Thalassotalea mangrovi]